MRKAFAIFICSFVGGCASLPDCTENFSKARTDDTGKIIVYRIKQFVASGSPEDIYINDCVASAIKANEIKEFNLPQGNHEIGVFDVLFGKWRSITIPVYVNQETFIRIHHVYDGAANPPIFTVVTREQAITDKIDGMERY